MIYINFIVENKTPEYIVETHDEADPSDEGSKHEVKGGGGGESKGKEQVLPQHFNAAQLREHLDIPITVDQKMIHDILGVIMKNNNNNSWFIKIVCQCVVILVDIVCCFKDNVCVYCNL